MNKALIAVSVLSLAVGGWNSQATEINKSPKKVAQLLLASNSAAAASANAVVVPKKAKSKSKTKASKVNSAAKAEAAPVKETAKVETAPVNNAKNIGQKVLTPVPNPATGGIAVSTVVKPETAKKFSPGLKFTWLSLNSMDLKTVENFQKNEKDELDPEVTAWEQPTISYQFTKNTSFGVMPQFFHTWFGLPTRPQDPLVKSGDLKQGGTFFMGDIALSLKQKELIKVGDTTVAGTLRYDLPTSERSQANNSPGSLWATADVTKSVGKWDFALNIWTRFYFQNYLTSTLRDAKDNTLQNPMYREYFVGNVGYNFTKTFSIGFDMGVKDTISYGDEVSRDIAYGNNRLTDIWVTYVFSPTFNVSFGLSEELNMRKQTRDFNIPFDTTNDAGGGSLQLVTSFAI